MTVLLQCVVYRCKAHAVRAAQCKSTVQVIVLPLRCDPSLFGSAFAPAKVVPRGAVLLPRDQFQTLLLVSLALRTQHVYTAYQRNAVAAEDDESVLLRRRVPHAFNWADCAETKTTGKASAQDLRFRTKMCWRRILRVPYFILQREARSTTV
jgi:hypothetical protein